MATAVFIGVVVTSYMKLAGKIGKITEGATEDDQELEGENESFQGEMKEYKKNAAKMLKSKLQPMRAVSQNLINGFQKKKGLKPNMKKK